MDLFKSTPPNVTVQLESQPAGAEARTSTGQSCKTPCSVAVPAAENFSVTFSLPKYQPETVPVQIIRGATDAPEGVAIDPNPVYAELQPAAPAPHKGRAKTSKAAPKAKRSKAAPAAAPAAPETQQEESSPFPPPPSR